MECQIATGSPGRRPKVTMNRALLRSAITNGSALLHDVDHRTAAMRRLRDLLEAHYADAGGEEFLSEGQRALICRACMLQLQCELLDSKFARNNGSAGAKDLDLYGRCAGNLRRLIESLGLNLGRIKRDVTPTLSEYLATNYGEAAATE
jgi:hypothetical protein